MKLSYFDYNLPSDLIAQRPKKPRDHSRLSIMNRSLNKIEHKKFFNIIGYLKKGDVLVMNNSKVFPARLIGKKKKTGGKIEIFLTSPPLPFFIGRMGEKRSESGRDNIWQCLIGGRGAKAGLQVDFNKGLVCEVVKDNKDGTWEAKFNVEYKKMMKIVDQIGQTPLPPYIKRAGNTCLPASQGRQTNIPDCLC